MFKVQEFYCKDTPVDARDIREAIHYANTHNCAVKITSWLSYPTSPVCKMASEYIFPNESFEVVCERFKYLMR